MEKWGIRFGKFVPKVKTDDLVKSWKIVKGDIVEVISGSCKGQQGKVIKVERSKNSVIVEGVNLVQSKKNENLLI
jgi:transcription antitermination factor NusG